MFCNTLKHYCFSLNYFHFTSESLSRRYNSINSGHTIADRLLRFIRLRCCFMLLQSNYACSLCHNIRLLCHKICLTYHSVYSPRHKICSLRHNVCSGIHFAKSHLNRTCSGYHFIQLLPNRAFLIYHFIQMHLHRARLRYHFKQFKYNNGNFRLHIIPSMSHFDRSVDYNELLKYHFNDLIPENRHHTGSFNACNMHCGGP